MQKHFVEPAQIKNGVFCFRKLRKWKISQKDWKLAWCLDLTSQCSGKDLKWFGDCCHVESSQIEPSPMKIRGFEREPLKFWEMVEVSSLFEYDFFVCSTYAMKSWLCKFGIFRGSFAIFNWFIVFLAFNASNSDLNYKSTNYCTKMVTKICLAVFSTCGCLVQEK